MMMMMTTTTTKKKKRKTKDGDEIGCSCALCAVRAWLQFSSLPPLLRRHSHTNSHKTLKKPRITTNQTGRYIDTFE